MWYSWESIGGKVDSDLSAISWEEGRVDLFAKNASGELEHLYSEDGEWSKWKEVTLFNREPDNSICFRAKTKGIWSDWESLGGEVVSAPAATSRRNDGLKLFVVGTDHAIWLRRRGSE